MHLVHLDINSLLSKKDEICYIAKPTNATVIGFNKTWQCSNRMLLINFIFSNAGKYIRKWIDIKTFY